MFNIAVLEYYPLHKQIPGVNVWSQDMHPVKSYTPKTDKEHGYWVLMYKIHWLKHWLTDQEIQYHVQFLYMKKSKFALNHCINKNVMSVNVSSQWMDYDKSFLPSFGTDALERKVSEIIPMFAAVGNDGNELDHYEAIAASRESFIGVGAVNPQHKPRSYSSWGNGHVVFCGVDGLIDNKLGTSYAVCISGLADGYRIKHALEMGYLPDKTQTLAKLRRHTKDIHELGFDLKTGYGVVEMPNKIEFLDTVYDLKTKKKTMRHFIDGHMYEQETDRLVRADICDPSVVTEYFDKVNRKRYFSHLV